MTTAAEHDVRHTDMGRQCDFCKGKSFRRSRLQGKDWGGLILMRYPVRCLSCSQRQSVGIAVAMRSVSSKAKQTGPASHDFQTGAASGSHAAQPIGGGSFPALRARQSVVMPNLHGVTLEHLTPEQGDGEHLHSERQHG
jgi:hypothetical protein